MDIIKILVEAAKSGNIKIIVLIIVLLFAFYGIKLGYQFISKVIATYKLYLIENISYASGNNSNIIKLIITPKAILKDISMNLSLFLNSLIVGFGSSMTTPPITLELYNKQHELNIPSAQPHNALQDALALKRTLFI